MVKISSGRARNGASRMGEPNKSAGRVLEAELCQVFGFEYFHRREEIDADRFFEMTLIMRPGNGADHYDHEP